VDAVHCTTWSWLLGPNSVGGLLDCVNGKREVRTISIVLKYQYHTTYLQDAEEQFPQG